MRMRCIRETIFTSFHKVTYCRHSVSRNSGGEEKLSMRFSKIKGAGNRILILQHCCNTWYIDVRRIYSVSFSGKTISFLWVWSHSASTECNHLRLVVSPPRNLLQSSLYYLGKEPFWPCDYGVSNLSVCC